MIQASLSHIEIAGKNGKGLWDFYQQLFGWTTQSDLSGDAIYPMVHQQVSETASIGIRHEPEGCAEIVLYFTVNDLNAAVTQAKQLGASSRLEPMDGGDVLFALMSDPEGNPFGMVQPKELESESNE